MDTTTRYSDSKDKEKIYEHQLSKISELVDDLYSTDFLKNSNYGIIPLNVLHNIMLFQSLSDLLSMSLSCSLFHIVFNSSYFWKSYYYVCYKAEIFSKNDYSNDVDGKNHWKKEFFKRYHDLVFTWGNGENGELGHGKTENESIPKLVENLIHCSIENVYCRSSYTRHYSSSVVLSNGDLLSCGYNHYRRLGHERKNHKILTPKCLVKLPENRKIIQVTTGYSNSFFLDEFGDIWGCGSNRDGYLTGKKSDSCFHKPVKIEISGSPKIIKIVSGYDRHFGCICSSGNLYTWGNGSFGKLGHGNESDVLQPQIVKYFEKIRVKDVSMGHLHTLVLSEDGKIYSFGSGSFGQLGNGKRSNSSSPELIEYFCEHNLIVTNVSCGFRHSGCLDSFGNCYMWGRGSNGQIGNGSCIRWTNSTPIRILSFVDSSGKKVDLDIPNTHKFIQLDCGGFHNISLLESKTENERKTFVLTWGNGKYGQLGLNNEDEYVNIPTVVPFFENQIVKSVHSGGEMCAVIL